MLAVGLLIDLQSAVVEWIRSPIAGDWPPVIAGAQV